MAFHPAQTRTSFQAELIEPLEGVYAPIAPQLNLHRWNMDNYIDTEVRTWCKACHSLLRGKFLLA